jgi:Arc/MetJ family transcription regulator
MRTTIRLDEQLLAAAKQTAAASGRTLTAVIEDALRETLARGTARPGRRRLRLTTVGGNGPLPGVDLDDTASLLELMESARGTD